MAVDLHGDRGVLPDLDFVAVAELERRVRIERGVVDYGSVGGVQVSDHPLTRFGVDDEVVGGDAGVFDGEVVAADDPADSDLGSGSVL